MKSKLTHFAIHTDDIKRARAFYSKVFNWKFQGNTASGFLQIKADDSEDEEVIGSLQSRKFSLISDTIIGLECTIKVKDIDATIQSVKDAGGRLLLEKTPISSVGWITKFIDTEGNIICAMEYDSGVI